MFRTILIDDEPLSHEILQTFLRSYPQFEIIAKCMNGFEGLKAIQENKPDLVFLDIQMPKINGFEMLELLENPPPVIFTTAYDEYAIKGFEANAIDYLLKPFSEDRLKKALDKFFAKDHPISPTLEQFSNHPLTRIVVKTGAKVKIIPVGEILFIQADGDYIKIFTEQGSYLKNRTMTQLEKTLDPQNFIRIHRSYLIQLNQITRIEPLQKERYQALLRTGEKIPVSRSGYLKLKEVLRF